MLSSAEYGDVIVVADLEAGIGTLTRMEDSAIDLTVIVVEPTPRSLDVAYRAMNIAREKNQGRIVAVLNKVDDIGRDVAFARTKLGDVSIVTVPNDGAVFDADRSGVSLLDHDPNAPALQALSALTDLVVEMRAAPVGGTV